ncbi:amino acid racemase [Clostridium sp. 19966]|uniref:aspartate/glutamate racemase family protein n=1 Tax=Clostridium sp. 19966 TaxID=2768166 RepID=UPI0028DDF2FF|nr:amino acid racemase [Clostridium sp. 19966]MDT8715993.1 amino acid racemase [Clostridium sp. 19966]
MKNGLIGILAGMGPRSTAPFIDLVVDECQYQYGAVYDEEFPPMMIYSLPTPFYVDRPIDDELMKKTIIKGLKKLEETGAAFIAMPCNSAHIYFKELENSISIPLLNIVTETLNSLPKKSKRVTLFSTASTFKAQIYQKEIITSGHDFIFSNQWQITIDRLIQSIKLNRDNPENIEIWKEILDEVKEEGIESIIIACTDLNAVTDKVKTEVRIVDSASCLAKTVIRNYLQIIE